MFSKYSTFQFLVFAPSRTVCRAFWTVAVACLTAAVALVIKLTGGPGWLLVGVVGLGLTVWAIGWIRWRSVPLFYALWQMLLRWYSIALLRYLMMVLTTALGAIERLCPSRGQGRGVPVWEALREPEPIRLERFGRSSLGWIATLIASAETRRDRWLFVLLAPFLLFLSVLPLPLEESGRVPLTTYTFS